MLARLRPFRVVPEAAAVAPLPRPEQQPDDEREAEPGAAHHPPEEARDVPRLVALRRERVLRLAAARKRQDQGK